MSDLIQKLLDAENAAYEAYIARKFQEERTYRAERALPRFLNPSEYRAMDRYLERLMESTPEFATLGAARVALREAYRAHAAQNSITMIGGDE